MAYDLVDRFSRPPKYYRFYDPGTYQFEKPGIKHNVVPFLSKTPRNTSTNAPVWTETIYNANIPKSIPNISVLKSTVKRFPYEAFSTEDLEAILCRCGVEKPCSCSDSENGSVTEVCQRNVKRRLYKGSVSSGLKEKLPAKNECPPFYDARINESTAFYHGWKWSQRTSKRSQYVVHSGPGPAEYSLEKHPTAEAICIEKVRALKRKTSKQLRFIEKVQQQNILEGRPGPGAYTPEWPKGTDLNYIGPKSARFTQIYSMHPGPAEYWVRRDFDPPDPPEVFCRATLPEPSCFGVKANRFTPQKEEGPSPAAYNTDYVPCRILNCSKVPFSSSTARFKEDVVDDSDDDELDSCPTEPVKSCPNTTWEFKSKTIRMKPLVKNTKEYCRTDTPQPKNKTGRSLKLQYIAPFNTSEGRFQPWYCYIPVHGKYVTLGPCYYNAEMPKCVPAFNHGPLYRAERFQRDKRDTPAPNEYKVFHGIETILKTHNSRLADNIEKKLKFVWKRPPEPSSLTYEQREALLIQKCIDLLEPDPDLCKKSKLGKGKPNIKVKPPENTLTEKTEGKPADKPKMLRYFLYSHRMPSYV